MYIQLFCNTCYQRNQLDFSLLITIFLLLFFGILFVYLFIYLAGVVCMCRGGVLIFNSTSNINSQSQKGNHIISLIWDSVFLYVIRMLSITTEYFRYFTCRSRCTVYVDKWTFLRFHGLEQGNSGQKSIILCKKTMSFWKWQWERKSDDQFKGYGPMKYLLGSPQGAAILCILPIMHLTKQIFNSPCITFSILHHHASNKVLQVIFHFYPKMMDKTTMRLEMW